MLHSAASMVDDPTTPTVAAQPHRPWLAALLSFAFPGLGHAYSGRWREAALFGLPVVLLVVAGAALVTGLAGDRNSLLSRGFLTAVMVLNGLLLVWRLVAIAHAGLTPVRAVAGRHRRRAGAVVVGLIVASIAMHAWVGIVAAHLEGTLTQVFAGAPPEPVANDPTPLPTGNAPRASDPPPTFRWDGKERINVLLLGTDAAPGRSFALTDVLLLVSVDPVEGTAAMISVPRDTGFVPLPDASVYPDGVFPEKINELSSRAAENPEEWCPDLADDPQACGLRSIRQAIGLYLGVEVHRHALVDMTGFAEMIDAIGGVELCLPGRLVDPEFDGSLENRERDEPLVLPAGCHHYDGIDALAYARSRKGWIEMPDGTREPQSDFTRSERQQQVLLALRHELAQADTLFELPGLLGAISRTVSTDLPRERAGDLVNLVPLITGPDIDQVVLGYPGYVDLPLQPDVNYLLIPRRDAIREEMARIFGADELRGWWLAGEGAPPAQESNELPR